MMGDNRDDIVKALITGLTTDGEHHKQYWLEQAFRLLCVDNYVDEAKEEFGWEEGQP